MKYSVLRKVKAIIGFYLSKNIPFLILLIIGMLIIGYISAWGTIGELPPYFVKFLDPLFGLYGILFTLGFTLFYAHKEWQNGLEKRLTVHFEYQQKYIMSCYEAYLASEGDIRAWGQQIGSQMINKEHLDIYPYLTQERPSIQYDESNRSFYVLYTITLHLRTMDALVKKVNDLGQNYLIWWENDNKTQANKSLFILNHPSKPLTLAEIKSKYDTK